MSADRKGKRLSLGLVFGGRSPEHDVSLVSARAIFEHIDKDRYEVMLVGIDRQGRVRVGDQSLLGGAMDQGAGQVVRWPSSPTDRFLREEASGNPVGSPIDVFFPIVHGAGGEDGTIQGVFSLAGIPFVGAGVFGAASALDKDIARRLLAAEGLPTAGASVFESKEIPDVDEVLPVIRDLGWPVFVKPARAGSSLGISKVAAAAGLAQALAAARAVDSKIVIEQAVPDAREIEVALVGHFDPRASRPGEVVPGAEFYDYDAKYRDSNSKLLIPAPIDDALAEEIREMALRAFRALDLSGMARVDFLLPGQGGRPIINEVNTHPGFTPISMYPKLWEAEGVSFRELLDRLVDSAFQKEVLGALRCV